MFFWVVYKKTLRTSQRTVRERASGCPPDLNIFFPHRILKEPREKLESVGYSCNERINVSEAMFGWVFREHQDPGAFSSTHCCSSEQYNVVTLSVFVADC